MLKELDIVVLARDLPAYGLKQGDVGAIVHSYAQDSAFEVEFVTADGQTVAVLTLTSNDIRARAGREILHVRELTPA